MKQLSLVLTLILSLQRLTAGPTPDKIINSQMQCLLTMRVFPLEYIEKTNTMQTKVHFESNCMPYIHTQYLVIPYDNYNQAMSLAKHPKNLVLVIAEQTMVIKFSDPVDEADGNWAHRRYMTALVEPNNFQGEQVNLKALNGFLIANKGDKKKPFFTRKVLEDVWNSVNPGKISVQGSLSELVGALVKGEQLVKAY